VNLEDSIQRIFRRVEMSLSPFADSSLVSRINRGETNLTDSLFRHVFESSKRVNMLSGGLFDPTVSPLVNLWGFGFKKADHEPSEAEIEEALKHVGIQRCRIERDTIVRAGQSTEFNFSAITKGYGCDMIGEMLKQNGVNDYMIEIGGEIAVAGINPSGEKWRIMIDAPVENDSIAIHRQAALISISDCGLATSGNYRNFRDTKIGRVGHTINPLTGYPAQNSPTLSASVIAENAMLADALATACMAMLPDSAMKMIEKIPGAEVMLVLPGDTAEWKIAVSSGFPTIEKGIVR